MVISPPDLSTNEGNFSGRVCDRLTQPQVSVSKGMHAVSLVSFLLVNHIAGGRFYILFVVGLAAVCRGVAPSS
jgi:hypothetical protein